MWSNYHISTACTQQAAGVKISLFPHSAKRERLGSSTLCQKGEIRLFHFNDTRFSYHLSTQHQTTVFIMHLCVMMAAMMVSQLSVSKGMVTPQSQQRLWVSEEVIVFSRGEGGYYCIKIPVLLTTAKGTLIAFGEGRMLSCSDFTWTDLIYKRSIDGGKTWGPLQVLYSNSSMDSGIHTVIGNAAPVVLDSHRILVPFCRNNLQVLLMYSDDDGVNWSKPVNITGVTQPSWTW